MKPINYLSLLSFLALFAACSGEGSSEKNVAPEVSTTKAMLGTWETVEMEVDYLTYGGQDTSAYEIIREADWGQIYGAKPPRTVFTPDGKLKRTHRLASGQVADIVNGLWKIHSTDTMLFIEPNKTLFYHYILDGESLKLRGIVDADLDGEVDDEYRSVLRLVGRTE
jgi:hypothetical protein